MAYTVDLQTVDGTFSFGDAPDYRQIGQWNNEFIPGARQYEKSYYDQCGVDSKGIKRHGYRQSRHKMVATLVGDSIGSIYSRFDDICSAIANTSIDIAVDVDNGGPTFPRCELESAETYCGTPVPNEAGFFYAACTFSFIQIGLVSIQ